VPNTQELGPGQDATPRLTSVPSAEAVRQELDKILVSQTFRSAEGQRNFLRYTVEQVLEGRGDLVKEYSVGIEVFGRGDSFDPRLDTIVRTEARKLRSRLAKYYETEGTQDTVRIEFPKGSYAPVFHPTVEQAQGIEQPVARPEAPPDGHAAQSMKRKRVWLAVVAVLILAGGLFVVNQVWHRRSASNDAPSIAVLPFLNLSDDKQDEFFSDGLTEELIDSLARAPGLHVVARTSVFQYKGKPLDIRKIGRELNVRTVMEGSVRKYGDRLRITAQLDDAANGYHLWSQSYDRELKDTLVIQREISQAITSALSVKLSTTERNPGFNGNPNAAASVNPGAYQNYLKGRYFSNKYTGETNQTAIRFFEQAIADDPNYAPAYAGLSTAYAETPEYELILSDSVVPKIRAAAGEALRRDATLGEAHIALALADEYDFDWATASSEFETGLELSPGDAVAHRKYAIHLMMIGQFEQSLTESRRALDLDPVSPYMAQAVARTLYQSHRLNEAAQEFQKALALDPNFGRTLQGLGIDYLQMGMYADGVRETEKGHQVMGDDSVITAQLGYAYALAGNAQQARQILNRFLEQSKRGFVSARAVALVYIGLDDKDHAFEWLRKAIDQRDVNLYLKSEPVYDRLRGDPRFQDLLRRMKLS